MYTSLDLFQTAHAMARHAGARQTVVAQNIANADTPGYQAMQIASFQDAFDGTSQSAQMQATRPGHFLNTDALQASAAYAPSEGEPSPNGNTVSLEDELMNSIAISREHNRALSIYRHTMTILRTSLGRN
ncbi:FlgB family protein [Yoonia sp. BS5-3]|uniref:FlgB family protein n=1 Tax=Yoonia phaeophyticola TaxID=3137369 RepID=A0ABZ2V805_9RHOB